MAHPPGNTMILKTARLALRPLERADVEPLFAILSDPVAMAFWNHPPLTRLAVATEIVESQLAAMADGGFRCWSVLEDGAVIGSLDLGAIEHAQARAETGFQLRRDRWGRGLGFEAMAALIGHAFGPLGLARLSAWVQPGNTRAIRLLDRLGFTREGVLRGHLLKDGTRRDVAVHGLLRDRG